MSKENHFSPYKSPNIVLVPTNYDQYSSPHKRHKLEKSPIKSFSHYKSPNIVVVPTDFNDYSSPCKRLKLDTSPSNKSAQHDLSFLDDFDVDEIVNSLNNCEENDSSIQNEVSEMIDSEFISAKDRIFNKHPTQTESNKNNNNNILDKKSCNRDILSYDVCKEKNNIRINIIIQQSNKPVKSKNVELEEIQDNNEEKNKSHCESDDSDTDKTTIQENSVESECQKINDTKDYSTLQVQNQTVPTIVDKKEDEQNSIHEEIKKAEVDKEIVKKQLESNMSSKDLKPTTSEEAQCTGDITITEKLENNLFKYLKVKHKVDSLVHCGKYAKIYKCLDPNGKPFAVKMLNQNRHVQSLNQYKMLMNLQATIGKERLFTVHLAKGFLMDGHRCFVMDFYSKNLEQALEETKKPFNIDTVQVLARQLVAAVSYLKRKHIIHSDIRPNHILLSNSIKSLKLCGFDRYFSPHKYVASPLIGSANYRPPEVILGFILGYSIDIWTTALVLHEMATVTRLFEGYYNYDILFKQMSILGTIPKYMLQRSIYASNYFDGGGLMRRYGTNGMKTGLPHFFKKTYIVTETVYQAYYNYWAFKNSKQQKYEDLNKIRSFTKLLDQMLVICPTFRINIENVSVDPFIWVNSNY